MSSPGSGSNQMVRRAANTIMFAMLVASGVSLSLLLAGRTDLALQFCGISGAIIVILLLIGAYMVAKSR